MSRQYTDSEYQLLNELKRPGRRLRVGYGLPTTIFVTEGLIEGSQTYRSAKPLRTVRLHHIVVPRLVAEGRLKCESAALKGQWYVLNGHQYPSAKATMTEAQALGEAKRRWGRNGWVRLNPDAPLEAEREKIKEELKALRSKNPHRPITGFTPEQRVAYSKEVKEYGTAVKQLQRRLHHERCTVGDFMTLPGFGACSVQQGAGDTWEEAFADVGALRSSASKYPIEK